MDIHEAAVTACKYVADCPHDVIPALYQVGIKQKKTGFSGKVRVYMNNKSLPASRRLVVYLTSWSHWHACCMLYSLRAGRSGR